jgi:hypothetical protein
VLGGMNRVAVEVGLAWAAVGVVRGLIVHRHFPSRGIGALLR